MAYEVRFHIRTALVSGLFIAAILISRSSDVEAQPNAKVWRLGYLDPSSPSIVNPFLEAFRQEMGRLGWIEGKNISIQSRFSDLNPGRMLQLAEELINWKADVILAAGGGPSSARKVTATIPIVVASGVDLVQAGLAASLARPGGNVTGLSILGPELITKRLEMLRDVVPKLSRVGVLMRAGAGAGTGQQQQMDEIRAAALSLKLALVELPSEMEADSLDRVFRTATQQQVNAIVPTAGRQTLAAKKPIVELALKYRLPAIYQEQEFVDAGGLMSYGPDFADLYRRAAYFVDKILKGAKPADLPIEQPRKFDFVINLKTAKQIGLIIPPNVLARADRVIK